MISLLFLMAVLAITLCTFYIGRNRAVALANNVGGISQLNSLPNYYGVMMALYALVPTVTLVLLWTAVDDSIIRYLLRAKLDVVGMAAGDISLLINSVESLADNPAAQVASGVAGSDLTGAADYLNTLRAISANTLMLLAVLVLAVTSRYGWQQISIEFKARNKIETVFKTSLFLCACLAIFITVGIVFSVLMESLRFFAHVSPIDFWFGTHWSPQSYAFGAVPLFTGTLLISALAMLVSVPEGLMIAIYLSEYASSAVRTWIKPLLEILAGVPTVVYGFFAALTVAPFIRDIAEVIGLSASSESALAAGLVMGVMIIPFVSSLSDDVINAVPQSLRDGAYGLGSTQSETIKLVILPAALPGVAGAILLAVSRAIGETMIVVMAAGLAANLTANPLEAVTTVTVQMVTLFAGDQEFDSPKTLVAFALGLTLFVVTLGLNFLAQHIVNKYREQYD